MISHQGTVVWSKYLCGVYVVVLIFIASVECGKYGGGRSRGGGFSFGGRRPSPSPSYSHPSPSYSRPSPSYSHPSPASLSYPSWHPAPASRPASHPSTSQNSHVSTGGSYGNHGAIGPPTHGSNTQGGSSPPGIGFKPSVTQGQTGSYAKPNAQHTEHVVNSKPLGSANVGSGSGVQPPPIGFKPEHTGTNVNGQHSGNPSQIGFKPSAPPAEHHASNAKPLGTGNSGQYSGNPPPYGFKPSAPVGPPTNVKPVGNLPPGAPYQVHPPPYTPHNPGVPPPAYNPAHNPAGYGPPPAYNPAGYGAPPPYNPSGYGHYPQQQYHPGGYGYQTHGAPGVTNININNINTNSHHYGGGGYGGYGYSYPSYHYSGSDVGSGTLGFFLGYSLAKVTTPTFHYHSGFYDGYTPRYDHYEVHHYYHNRDSIPAHSTIQPSTITGCVGDSGSICPVGTTSLCTSNGAILCVASATSTVPCADAKQGNCVRTTIPCVNGTSGCEVGQNTTVAIPCISKAQVPGNITYVNNTIIVNNTTIINNNGNATTTNSTTLSSSSTVQNGTNITDSVVAALGQSTTNSTIASVVSTTTEAATTLPPIILSTSTDGSRSKRETPSVPVNDFCVTILALPAERKPTEQEQLVEKGTSIFSKFLVRALGVNNL